MLKRMMTGALMALTCFGQDSAPQMSERAVLRIARDVQKQILSLPNYGLFDDIRFAIKGYEVILKGMASRPTLKSSAEQVVKKIEGVEKVTNEIEVLPLSPQDNDIRVAAYVRIYGHPTLSRYNPNRGSPIFRSQASVLSGIVNDPPPGYHPIHIIVNRGNITLEGVVDTVGDRTIAELQANSVPGSFAVTNNLRVANQEQMADMKEMKRKKGK
jgi:osmotically-inducible protein OsmY